MQFALHTERAGCLTNYLEETTLSPITLVLISQIHFMASV